jgi:hypothetical protein
VIAEEMFKAGLPWVAIDPKGDWWGMRSSGDGKGPGLPIVVFGGLHADVPLEPGAGQLVADIVVDQRLTCVIDISEMTKADQRRFLTPFVRRLYQKNREPLHVFAEEADEYIPQLVRGDDAEMVGVWETLVKRGGFRGLGCTLITQRSASLNNDVLTQVQTLIALRTTGVPDRKRVEEWVSYHQTGKELVQQLPTLEDGQALVFSPNFLRTVTRIRFRRRETFDSGATPKVGMKVRPPAILADVDLAVLRDRMATTIEKQKADDPRELRKRIAELERELKKAVSIPVSKEIRVEVPVPIDPRTLRELGEAPDMLRTIAMAVEMIAKDLATNHPAQLKGRTVQPAVGAGAVRSAAHPHSTAAAAANPPGSTARPVRSAAAVSDGNVKLGAGERKVLAVLAQWPDGRAQKDVAFLAGYSAKASTLGVILSNLRRQASCCPASRSRRRRRASRRLAASRSCRAVRSCSSTGCATRASVRASARCCAPHRRLS